MPYVISPKHNLEDFPVGLTLEDKIEVFIARVQGWLLGPAKEIVSAYRKKEMDWQEFEMRFKELIRGRMIEKEIDISTLDGACLLCSEHNPKQCHRRLVAEYIQEEIGDIDIYHLL
jgi:uncharacterized protein YeaO (DUF488 family)